MFPNCKLPARFFNTVTVQTFWDRKVYPFNKSFSCFYSRMVLKAVSAWM